MRWVQGSVLLFFAMAFAGGAAGDEPPPTPLQGKPACNAEMAGHQWPEEAADPVFAAALAPYGYPMLCTHTVSGYSWRSINAHNEPSKRGNKSQANSKNPERK